MTNLNLNLNLTDLIIFIVLIVAGFVVGKIVSLNVRRALKDRIPKYELEITVKFINYIIVAVFILIALPHIGVEPAGVLAVGGFAGLVIGFASQKIVANLVSGLFLVIERPLKIGDQVKIGDVMGFVEEIHIMSTIIRTYDGLNVRIPNETVFTSEITNLTKNPVRRFEYVVGIRYSDDADKAIEIIKRVIDEHPFALKNPEPQVFVSELGDSSVNIVVRIWAPTAVWYDVRMELLWKIKTELEKEGIEIPFPQRVVWFANPLELRGGFNA